MASIDIQFRIATLEDAPRVQQLVEASFRAHDTRKDWTDNLELASNFRLDIEQVKSNIARVDMVTIVAVATPDGSGDGNQTATLVASIEVAKRGADIGRLSMIAVDQQYQQTGLGRRVLAYAEDYCHRTWGVTKFSLNALSARKALIAWYMRRGYRDTGDRSPFPREKFSMVSLPEDLCFIELEKDF